VFMGPDSLSDTARAIRNDPESTLNPS